MKRVLFFAAVSFASGILLKSISSAELFRALSGCLFIFLLFCIVRKKYETVVLCTAIAVLGFLYMGIYADSLAKKTAFYEGCEVFVTARVLDVYEKGDSYFADVKTEKARCGSENTESKIKIRVYFYGKPDIKYGDIIEFSAKFKRQNDLVKRASKLYGAALTCSVYPDKIKVLGGKTSLLNPFDLAHNLRYFTEKTIYTYFDGDTAGLLSGIITGSTLNMSDPVKNSFRICSLSHVTAVSGMHVGIVLTLAMSVFAVLRIKKHKVSIICYIAIIWFFALFAGLGASAVRASLTATLFFAAYMLRRDSDPLTSLAAASFVMLLINPAVIYDLGFELSVLSTAGIIVFQPLIYGRIKKYTGVLAVFISVTASAQLATLPAVIYYFGYISLLGLFANVLICPAIPIIMGLGIALLALSKITVAAVILAAVLKMILTVVIYIVIFISNVPFAAVSMGFNALWACAYVILCAALYLLLIKKRRKALYTAALSLALFSLFAVSSCFLEKAELSFLSVGNGDCAVFKTNNAVVMIDGGGMIDRDIGREAVLPYLRREGISKVNIAFLTHPHIDHGRGFVPLLHDGIIENIVLPPGTGGTELGAEIETAAKIGGARICYIKDGNSFDFGGITVKSVSTADGEDENNGVVYFLTYGDNKICFTGDINKNAEKRVRESEGFMACRILKVAHHGSKTSSDSAFLKDTGAKFAVIPCGGEKFPADETVKAIKDAGMSFAMTKTNGDIKIIMNRKRIKKIRLERGSINEL